MDAFGSDIEIFEFAIGREIEAYGLYMTLASRIENEDLRKVFETFAQDELGHKAKLELELMKRGKTVDDRDPEIESLTDLELDQNVDYKDVLVLAINKEREAFRIYVDLSQIVREIESREILLTLAEEEAKHRARFEFEYDQITQR